MTDCTYNLLLMRSTPEDKAVFARLRCWNPNTQVEAHKADNELFIFLRAFSAIYPDEVTKSLNIAAHASIKAE